MIGQQLPQINENATVCYSIRCDSFYHHFTDVNTAIVILVGMDCCFTGFYSQSEVVLAVFYCFAVREGGLVEVLVS